MYCLMLASVVSIGAPALKENRKPAESPAGQWSIVQVEFSGHQSIRKPDDFCSIAIDKDSISLLVGGGKSSSERVAFFQGNEIDFYPGDLKRLRKGIWKLSGDDLLICEAGVGKARPTDFSSAKGSGNALWTLKRIKKD